MAPTIHSVTRTDDAVTVVLNTRHGLRTYVARAGNYSRTAVENTRTGALSAALTLPDQRYAALTPWLALLAQHAAE